MQNKVVVHRPDGTLFKGLTNNFFPNKDRFHLADRETGEVFEIFIEGLKAVFFVKDFDGDSSYRERADVARTAMGKRIRVVFADGEVLNGYCQGFTAGRQGFFVFPSDPDSNNDRVFVVSSATKDVSFL